jgi:hypothetical protein
MTGCHPARWHSSRIRIARPACPALPRWLGIEPGTAPATPPRRSSRVVNKDQTAPTWTQRQPALVPYKNRTLRRAPPRGVGIEPGTKRPRLGRVANCAAQSLLSTCHDPPLRPPHEPGRQEFSPIRPLGILALDTSRTLSSRCARACARALSVAVRMRLRAYACVCVRMRA